MPLKPSSIASLTQLETDKGKHLIHDALEIRERFWFYHMYEDHWFYHMYEDHWFYHMYQDHWFYYMYQDQRMVESHSWKQVSSSAIFGKVG